MFFHTLLTGIGCGTFFHDFTNNLIHWDSRSQKILGTTKFALSPEEWFNIIHQDDRDFITSFMQKELAKKNPHINIVYRVFKNDDDVCHVKADTFVKYIDGVPISTYGLLQDITEIKQQEEELLRKNEELMTAYCQLKEILAEVEFLKKKEKENVYRATVFSAQHILNNLLNQLLLIKLKISKHPSVIVEISDKFDAMFFEASQLLEKLSSVENVDEEEIRNSIRSPK
ncbi:MAG: PAS domain-containing protein [Anaerolineae bacterium]|nr:PAS domain-containing protein [Anaerolineae bacterium]